MDELVVRILRTVACRTRLRILSRLATGQEATPTQLAHALRLRPDLVCAHLARLDSAGLVQRRRSGARCYYIARSPYSQHALSGQVTAWLQDALRANAPGAPVVPRSQHNAVDTPATPRDMGGAIFDAATAFTNTRRLQILRRLAGGAEVDAPTLSKELRMSDAAVSRHIDKLMRRGYVRVARRKHRLVCRLGTEAKTSFHGRLLEIVAGHWGRTTVRS